MSNAGIYNAKLSAEADDDSEDGAPLALPPGQLLPGCKGSHVPYLRHGVYTDGAACDVLGSRGRPRSAKVRQPPATALVCYNSSVGCDVCGHTSTDVSLVGLQTPCWDVSASKMRSSI